MLSIACLIVVVIWICCLVKIWINPGCIIDGFEVIKILLLVLTIILLFMASIRKE